jgi:hypothetical protein
MLTSWPGGSLWSAMLRIMAHRPYPTAIEHSATSARTGTIPSVGEEPRGETEPIPPIFSDWRPLSGQYRLSTR